MSQREHPGRTGVPGATGRGYLTRSSRTTGAAGEPLTISILTRGRRP
jgi:hypothetical protein